jgi:DNA-damage-inducible protein J
MAHTTNVNIRMDEDLKKQAEKLFTDLGMSMTTAINVFVRQAVNRGGIPFEISRRDGFYSDYNQTILKRSIDQLNSGNGTIHEAMEVVDD